MVLVLFLIGTTVACFGKEVMLTVSFLGCVAMVLVLIGTLEVVFGKATVVAFFGETLWSILAAVIKSMGFLLSVSLVLESVVVDVNVPSFLKALCPLSLLETMFYLESVLVFNESLVV